MNEDSPNIEPQIIEQLPVPGLGDIPANLNADLIPSGDFELILLDGHDEDIERCNYWVMSYQKGTLHPLDLVKREQVVNILNDAIETGVEETGEVLVADSYNEHGRFFYMVELPEEDFRQKAVWASLIVNVVKSWNQPTIGFSLTLKDINSQQLEEIFGQIFRSLHEKKCHPLKIFLIVRDINANNLLNTAIRLKAELESDAIVMNIRH